MVALPVIKCHAAGNDFVLLDNLQSVPYDYPSLARFLCRRRFGIGADGLLVALPASDAQTDVGLRIFNADGSEADMCGNGIRCLAKYVMSGTTYSSATLRVATKSGTVRCETIEAHGSPSIRVAMGVPCFAADGSGQAGGATRRLRRVRVGNAHCVVFTGSEVATFDLRGLARDVNAGARLGEEANVEIFRVVRGAIELRIWERGVGETMACGTGACAAAACAIEQDLVRSPVSVAMPGGRVDVAWKGVGSEIFLTGDAQIVFGTIIDIPENTARAEAPVAAG